MAGCTPVRPSGSENVWARLIPVNAGESSTAESVLISKDNFYIGRNIENDLALHGNLLISSKHGCISKGNDGTHTYTDMSSNGTVVDGQKLVKGMVAVLKHGTEIHLVFKKNSAQNITYVFELVSASTDDHSEHTQTYDAECDNIVLPRHAEVSGGTSSSPRGSRAAAEDIASAPEAKKLRLAGNDDMEETMRCPICQEILHCCISLQPCLHSFCGGCYADWMPESSQCPTCRSPVKLIAKNHMVQNLVDAFLKQNPEKVRPKEALDELDTKFKTIVHALGKQNAAGSDDNENDDEDSEYTHPPTATVHMAGHALLSGPNVYSFPVCRECPGFIAGSAMFASSGSSRDAGASSSAVVTYPALASRPPFSCPAGQQHLVCWCCMHMMPDRRADLASQPLLPRQHCGLCQHPYCGAYWRCEQAGCSGCLSQLKDFPINESALDSLVLRNPYESGVLKDYLSQNNKTASDFLTECCSKLDAGHFSLGNDYAGPFVGHAVTSSTYVCRRCALSTLKALAYQYRRDITDLPDRVKRRPNCHWGRSCRTQCTKPEHAARFNHICDQTRWT